MNSTKNRWTKEETDWMIENYPTVGPKASSDKLGRKVSVVTLKAWKLKLKYVKLPAKNVNCKVCRKCLIEKDLSEFTIRTENLRPASHCRQCKNETKTKQRRENHEEWLEKESKYIKNRRKTDLLFRITANLRCRMWLAIKGLRKADSTFALIGCSSDFIKTFIESKFMKGMTWENYGKFWQIDHIQPCITFDLTKEEEQRKCFHYSNLRPLWKTTEIARKFSDFESIGNLNRDKF